jgi:pimeloyl-ACP methyl ester carboxylesterase
MKPVDATAPETVVLVHGVLMRGGELALLARRLRRCGYLPRFFDYPSRNRNVHGNARALVKFIQNLREPVVHLVGHSLGGVLILHALQVEPELPPGRVVLLGTPARGSRVAQRLHRLAWGRWLLGNSLEGGLLETAPEWARQRELGVIAGRIPLGIGLILGVLSGAHDGTVAVAETAVKGAQGSIVLSTTHTGLVFSRVVADQVCYFLKHACFKPAATPR